MVYNVMFELRNGKLVAVEVEANSDAQANEIALILKPADATIDAVELPCAA